MVFVSTSIIFFLCICSFIFIISLLTKNKNPKIIKHVNITRVIPEDDTWEKRYLSLVREVWYMSDEELDDFSYDEDHEDVLVEMREMNVAIHAVRTKEDNETE